MARSEDVIRMTRDAGINIIANIMFGLPGETENTASETLDFANPAYLDMVRKKFGQHGLQIIQELNEF